MLGCCTLFYVVAWQTYFNESKVLYNLIKKQGTFLNSKLMAGKKCHQTVCKWMARSISQVYNRATCQRQGIYFRACEGNLRSASWKNLTTLLVWYWVFGLPTMSPVSVGIIPYHISHGSIWTKKKSCLQYLLSLSVRWLVTLDRADKHFPEVSLANQIVEMRP